MVQKIILVCLIILTITYLLILPPLSLLILVGSVDISPLIFLVTWGFPVTIVVALAGGWLFYLRRNYLLALVIPILLPLVHLGLSFLVPGIWSAA